MELLVEKIVEERQTPYLPMQEYSLGRNHRTAKQNGRGADA